MNKKLIQLNIWEGRAQLFEVKSKIWIDWEGCISAYHSEILLLFNSVTVFDCAAQAHLYQFYYHAFSEHLIVKFSRCHAET